MKVKNSFREFFEEWNWVDSFLLAGLCSFLTVVGICLHYANLI